MKLYKLCIDKEFIWNMMVYCGKSRNPVPQVPEKTFMSLTEAILDEERTVYTDN